MGTDPVRLADAVTCPIAAVRRTTTWPEFPTTWRPMLDAVYAEARAGNVRQDGHNVMLYLDAQPTVEVGIQVALPVRSGGEVRAAWLPAGPAVTAVHRGSFGRVGETHEAIIDWCNEHGHERTGVRWEVYGDWHEDERQLTTDVWYQLVVPDAPAPVDVVAAFNAAINARDLAALAELMTPSHRFVDDEGAATLGKGACVEAWRGFFDAFPDYRNDVADLVDLGGGRVEVTGSSSCAVAELDGPALWRAVVVGDRLDVWHVSASRARP